MSGTTMGGWAVLGAAVAIVTQQFVPRVDEMRWWLNSAEGVYITLGTLGLCAVALGTTMAWPPWRGSRWLAALAVWVGTNIGFTIVLFANGAGNLFPIVLTIGAAMTLMVIVTGALLGAGLRGLVQLVLGHTPQTT